MAGELVLLALVFTSVAVITGMTASTLVARWTPERRRLNALLRGVSAPASPNVLLHDPYAGLAKIARLRRRSPRRAAALRGRLIAAGYSSDAATAYSAGEVVCAAFGALLPLLLLRTTGLRFLFVGVAAGLLLPRVALTRRIQRRKAALRNGLPDALDLLVICLETGCTLTQAIGKVSEELKVAHPDLAQELSIVKAEIQAGKPKAEAFKSLAERTRLDDIRPLVTMFLQADRFGTSIGQALRTHAEASREKRRMRAEEQASKAGIKLVFPLVLCIFPAFYLVTLGPVVIHFVRVLFSGNILAP